MDSLQETGTGAHVANGSLTINADKLDVRGSKAALSLENGTSASFGGASSDSSSAVFFNGNVAAEEASISLQNTTVTMAADASFKAKTVGAAKSTLIFSNPEKGAVAIETASGDLAVMQSSELSDSYASAEEAMKAYAEQVAVPENVVKGGLQGKTADGWTMDAEGNTRMEKNASLASFGNFNGATYVQWRNEINSLHERLGEVRGDTQYGAWARIYGTESTIKDVTTVDVDTTTIQVGADTRVSNWLLGAAFAYTDMSSDFSNGKGESDGYTFSAYATGMFECGGYVDLIGRVGRLSTDLSSQAASIVDALKGSYDNTALALSVEAGYHWALNDTFFVEPQAELSYGMILGDDFTASNGVRISQDDFETLIGRIGTRIGAGFAEDKAHVFLSASLNHDFMGDADYTARVGNGTVRNLTNDLGGTWFTYGIGADYAVGNMNFYGTLERSNGSDFQQDLKYSVGASWRF